MYKKRLVAATVSIFAIGVVFGVLMYEHDTFSFRALFAIMALISIACIAVSGMNHRIIASKRISAAALAVAAFSLGVLRVSLYNNSMSNTAVFDGMDDSVVCEISEVNTSYVEARLISSEAGLRKGELVRVYAYNMPEKLLMGDRITANVTYHTKDTADYYANGISLAASGYISEVYDGSGVFYNIRKSISDNSQMLYSDFDYAEPISRAVVVGDRTGLDSYLFSLYKGAGISHLLAISGLHISLIAMSLYNFLIMLSLNQKISAMLSSVTAVAYSALVGFTPGALRAAVMLTILLSLRMFMRRSDSITSLFYALLLLLMLNPYSICSASLQLSFLCCLGIILIEPLLDNLRIFCKVKRMECEGVLNVVYRFIPIIFTPICISFVSSVFSFPVLFLSFDTVSYISPIINLVTVPLFSYGVKIAFVAFLISPISQFVGGLIAYPAGVPFDFVTSLARWNYDADIGIMSVHVPFMIFPFALSLMIIASLMFLSRNRTKAVLITSAGFCISLLLCGLYNELYSSNKTRFEYGFDSGEYIYYQSSNDSVYIDINGYTSSADAIYKNGKTSLDKYIMLDLNAYSLKRFDNISGSLKVYELHLPKPQNAYESNIFSQIKMLANGRNCDIIVFEDDYTYQLSEKVRVDILQSIDSTREETLVCFDVNGKRLRFLGKGFDNSAVCDLAVAMNGYKGGFDKIDCAQICVRNGVIEDGFADSGLIPFDKKLRIRFDDSESGFTVYEP